MHFNSSQSLNVITRISVNALKRIKFSLKRRLYNRWPLKRVLTKVQHVITRVFWKFVWLGNFYASGNVIFNSLMFIVFCESLRFFYSCIFHIKHDSLNLSYYSYVLQNKTIDRFNIITWQKIYCIIKRVYKNEHSKLKGKSELRGTNKNSE